MKCQHCDAEIKPEYVHAISSNICPGCGSEIMNNDSFSLLNELSSAMERMPNDPQGLAGWLLSNYHFSKIGEAKPVDRFHRKFDERDLKIAPEPSEFMKRTGLLPQVNAAKTALNKRASNPNIAELARNIANVPDPYSGGGEEIEYDSDRDDVEAYKEFQEAGFNPFGEDPVSEGGVDFVAGSTALQQEMLLSKTAEGKRVLTNEKIRKIKAQEGLSSGAGGFRRA